MDVSEDGGTDPTKWLWLFEHLSSIPSEEWSQAYEALVDSLWEQGLGQELLDSGVLKLVADERRERPEV